MKAVAYLSGFRAARDGNRKESGFPESAYRVSKAAEIALTLVHAREMKDKNVLVNAVRFLKRGRGMDVCCLVLSRLREHGHDQPQGSPDYRPRRGYADLPSHGPERAFRAVHLQAEAEGLAGRSAQL